MQKFLFKDYHFCHGHYYPRREFLDTHNLHHVFSVLLQKILQFVLVHRRDFAQLQSKHEALLKLKFLFCVLQYILIRNLAVHVGALSVKAS